MAALRGLSSSSGCPKPVPQDSARGAHFKIDQAASVATVAELTEYDAIIVGTPTRSKTLKAVGDVDQAKRRSRCAG
jgi:hypothetical protein